jgi:CDP-diacylglycerol--glycerol-3-phosphate 3-phosphatidyltransferase
MKYLPNLLTLLRLVLSLAMFAALVTIGAAEHGAQVSSQTGIALAWFSVIAFVVASVTDYFDGWLARRWGVTSLAGAILDPIADKILVCGAILGLMIVGLPYMFGALGGLILFREFAVSALREVLAPRGIKLPVTFMAKTKTTLQLIALGALMILWFWPAWNIPVPLDTLRLAWEIAQMVLLLATGVTLWTGVQYARAAAAALKPSPEGEGGARARSAAGR